MLLLLLLLSSTADSSAERVVGQQRNGSCMCAVNASVWLFPATRYGAVMDLVQHCEDSRNSLQAQVTLSSQRLPEFWAAVQNLTARLEPFRYLNEKGLYSALALQQVVEELRELETDITAIHAEKKTARTLKLTKEVTKVRRDIERMETSNTVNMKIVKEKLRALKNTAQSCRSIPRNSPGQCYKGLITSISSPVVTRVSPYGKSYISGAWGRQAQQDSPIETNSYWVQPLVSSHAWGNTLRVYPSYDDFMTATNARDFNFAPSATHTNSIEGPGAVLYGDGLYYHCYRSAEICRYNLTDNSITRVTLPGTGVGFNNKFPYCYYDCRAYSDIDVEVDETGLWAIYATVGNHGNLVVSKLSWDGEAFNVSQTWETQVFKKAVTNAFMVCGVLYATRYVDDFREEVFYAFDTATGQDDNSLALPLEKVAKGVASLSYNPADKRLYMYNDAYLLAYQASFRSKYT
ncbi:olfactomedin-4-like [Myripristis murdjan]|uniref:olfactomedin-4-like n=1 Tax=Myripristis murdjan TaxID=586833 RepID=UPI001175D36D|nr:olfactomedin-4-like [Myripristis murdjan]